ncbi:MAG: hypothetical protein OHK0017_09970 [Patescibacteria group bacterium]
MQFSPYFTQNNTWSEFWKTANSTKHDIFKLEVEVSGARVYAYVYVYPHPFNQKFLYIPRGPVIEFENSLTQSNIQDQLKLSPDVKKGLDLFWEKLSKSALNHRVTHIKIDLDYNTGKCLNIHNQTELAEYLKKYFGKKVALTTRQIQYLSTVYLDVKDLIQLQAETDYTNIVYLQNFFDLNRPFWLQRNKSIRNTTRRSLKSDWQISNKKTREYIEAFWNLHQQTVKRQKINTFPKDYFELLIKQDFSYLLTLSSKGEHHASWLGISLDSSLIHLFAGNSSFSLKNFGQPLLHLSAMSLAKSLDNQIYDFGGHDPTKGYGKFKRAYHGNIIDFPGSVNVITRPCWFYSIEFLSKIVKKIRSLKK